MRTINWWFLFSLIGILLLSYYFYAWLWYFLEFLKNSFSL